MGSFKIEHLIKSSRTPKACEAVTDLFQGGSLLEQEMGLLHSVSGAALVLL